MAYVHASQTHINTALPTKVGRGRVWGMLILLIVAAMVAFGIYAYLNRPTTYVCPSPRRCGTAPPIKVKADPLPPPEAFTSAAYGFTVVYPRYATPTDTSRSAIAWSGSYNEGPVTWQFAGQSANNNSPQQIVNGIQRSKYPNAQFVYSIPNADIGYTLGYGAVYDLFVNSLFGQSEHQRVVIIAAIKRGVAVTFYGSGPFVKTSLNADGHPNPAETPMVHEDLFREAIEGVTWKGDPPL